MKKFIKNIFIGILILLGIFSIVEVSLIIDGYMKVKEEEKIDKGKIEIHDNEIINSIRNTLTDLFVIGDSQLDEQVFLSENLNYIGSFLNKEQNYDKYYYTEDVIISHFYYNLSENYSKNDLRTSIEIKNAYKLEDGTYDIEFIVIREATDKKSKKLIKTEEEYYANFINENGKFLINKIYNIKDFNNYINKEHEISKYYTSSNKLYKKYEQFKSSQYSDIEKGYKTKEMLENEGYII